MPSSKELQDKYNGICPTAMKSSDPALLPIVEDYCDRLQGQINTAKDQEKAAKDEMVAGLGMDSNYLGKAWYSWASIWYVWIPIIMHLVTAYILIKPVGNKLWDGGFKSIEHNDLILPLFILLSVILILYYTGALLDIGATSDRGVKELKVGGVIMHVFYWPLYIGWGLWALVTKLAGYMGFKLGQKKIVAANE